MSNAHGSEWDTCVSLVNDQRISMLESKACILLFERLATTGSCWVMLIASTHAAQSHTLAFLWTMIRGIACLIVKGIFTAILLPERLATWSFRPSQHVLAYVIHIMWNITSARLQPKSDTCRSWSMTLDIPCVIVKREATLLSDRLAAAPLLRSDTFNPLVNDQWHSQCDSKTKTCS